MSKILIGGDSWGCGEWHKICVSHKGLEQYFTDAGYIVLNSSKGDSTNSESVRRLLGLLEESYTPGDVVFWFKTDTIRDIRPYDTFTEKLKQSGSIHDLIDSLSDKTYSSLQNLAVKYNTSINLIGGYSNLNVQLVSKYSNLLPLVPSMVDFLVGHVPVCSALTKDFRGISDWGIKNIDLSSLDYPISQQLIDYLDCMYHARDTIFRQPIFYPDGDHPNRNGHKLLFDYITKELNL